MFRMSDEKALVEIHPKGEPQIEGNPLPEKLDAIIAEAN